MLEHRDGVHASSRSYSAEGEPSCCGLPQADGADSASSGSSERARKPARRGNAAVTPVALHTDAAQHRHGSEVDAAGGTEDERRSAGDRGLEALIRAIVRDEHTLRHSFGTHAALFGVNPWRLQSWMGHKRIDETMIYVHVAENHRRETPESILAAAAGEQDPDRRVLKMLGARGSHVAASSVSSEESRLVLLT